MPPPTTTTFIATSGISYPFSEQGNRCTATALVVTVTCGHWGGMAGSVHPRVVFPVGN
jgi:hypothetical protein